VAGPAHAGTFGPAALDQTFGPEVRFLAIPPGMAPNRPPSDGLQFFGLLEVERRSGVLRVEIRDRDGRRPPPGASPSAVAGPISSRLGADDLI
jgi:alkaline phosphatase D